MKMQEIHDVVRRAVAEVKVTDVHTHIYPPAFKSFFRWGIDELLTYHYLIAEVCRWSDIPYEKLYSLSTREQADLVWQKLFVEHSPVSEACRGVLTVLRHLGLDTSARDLRRHRAFFESKTAEEYTDLVFEISGVESVVMTNDPFDDLERSYWESGLARDRRFHAALRVDPLLNSWEKAVASLRNWGYDVSEDFTGRTAEEIRRFLRDWIEKMDALYLAVSLTPDFAFPDDSVRSRVIEECILPVTREVGIPFAPMIGVKRLVNPGLRLAGDSVAKASIEPIDYLCANYPENKFLVTMLSRENQHELAVTARKFRNLMIFGCWWFLNNPSLIEEITRMRLELLGLSFIPQHSDARVTDQLIYKWMHSRKIIGETLADKYEDLARTGWEVTEEAVRRDVADLFGRNFWRFVGRSDG